MRPTACGSSAAATLPPRRPRSMYTARACFQTPRLADRVFEMAWTHNQVVLGHLNASDTEAQLYTKLAGAAIYPAASRRASASVLLRNRKGQSGLWGYGISGDLPIVLLRISDPS